MSLDQATIERILARQGAAPTPDNIARIQAFAASDPSILERYSMGTAPAQSSGGRDIRGGTGGQAADNAALLNLDQSINNSIAKTDLPAPPAQVMQGATPAASNKPAPRAAPSVPAPARSGAAAATEPDVPPQRSAAPFVALSPDTPYITATSSDPNNLDTGKVPGGIMDWIMGSLLGAGALGGAYRAITNRPSAGALPYQTPAPNAPANAPLPGGPNAPHMPTPAPQGPATQPGGVPQRTPAQPGDSSSVQPDALPPKQGAQTPQDVARMRGEVQAENYAAEAQRAAEAEMLKQQFAAQNQRTRLTPGQESARKTVDAAKRVFRR